jgi:hypothetical protein
MKHYRWPLFQHIPYSWEIIRVLNPKHYQAGICTICNFWHNYFWKLCLGNQDASEETELDLWGTWRICEMCWKLFWTSDAHSHHVLTHRETGFHILVTFTVQYLNVDPVKRYGSGAWPYSACGKEEIGLVDFSVERGDKECYELKRGGAACRMF